ncbi:hypothetical protein ACJX0J_037682, partial [Zea mays]
MVQYAGFQRIFLVNIIWHYPKSCYVYALSVISSGYKEYHELIVNYYTDTSFKTDRDDSQTQSKI